jgi:hypothetical protein
LVVETAKLTEDQPPACFRASRGRIRAAGRRPGRGDGGQGDEASFHFEPGTTLAAGEELLAAGPFGPRQGFGRCLAARPATGTGVGPAVLVPAVLLDL